MACHALLQKAIAEFECTHPGVAPAGLHELLMGSCQDEASSLS